MTKTERQAPAGGNPPEAKGVISKSASRKSSRSATARQVRLIAKARERLTPADAWGITLICGGYWFDEFDFGWAECPVCRCGVPTLAIATGPHGHLELCCFCGGCTYGELCRTLERTGVNFNAYGGLGCGDPWVDLRKRVQAAREILAARRRTA